MVKGTLKQDDLFLDDDDLFLDDDDDDFKNKDNKLSYNGKISDGEPIDDKTAIEKIFSPSKIIHDMEMTLRGYTIRNGEWVYTNNPIGTDDFINTTINGLRSVINEPNMISSMTEEDIEYLLKEKNYEFITILSDPLTFVPSEKTEAVGNMYDHCLQLFMGFLAGGHGSAVIRQIHASLYQEINKIQNDGWGINWNDKNIIKVGGGK